MASFKLTQMIKVEFTPFQFELWTAGVAVTVDSETTVTLTVTGGIGQPTVTARSSSLRIDTCSAFKLCDFCCHGVTVRLGAA